MVLLSRDPARRGPVSLTFSGASDDPFDVKKFIFYFDNVLMKEKNDKGKAEDLLPLLYGPAFDFYYSLFAADDTLTAESMDYAAARKAFFDKLQPQEDPEVATRSAVDLWLKDDDVISFVKKAESLLYLAVDFNCSAKFGLLLKAIQGHPELVQFVIFRSPTTCSELFDAIKMFDRNRKDFIPLDSISFKHLSPSALASDVHATEATLRNSSEDKLENLTSQLAELSLLVNKSQRGFNRPPLDERPCLYCGRQFMAPIGGDKTPIGERDALTAISLDTLNPPAGLRLRLHGKMTLRRFKEKWKSRK